MTSLEHQSLDFWLVHSGYSMKLIKDKNAMKT